MKASELGKILGIEQIVGDTSIDIAKVAEFEPGTTGALLWYNTKKEEAHIKQINKCVVIVPQEHNISSWPQTNTYLLSDNPRYHFAQALPLVYDGTLPELQVNKGKDILMHPSVVFDSQDMSYAKHKDGHYIPLHCVGGIDLADNVEIGAFTSIHRGSINNTVIGKGVKIGTHVHISHDVQVGENTLIISRSIIGGYTTIGKDVTISQGAIIRNRVTIGDGAYIGQGANVTKDVPAGETWVGNPAKKLR